MSDPDYIRNYLSTRSVSILSSPHDRMVYEPQPDLIEQREEGRERKLLPFLHEHSARDDIQGHPEKVLELIQEFQKTYHLMNVGPEKGRFITELIAERKPQTMIELGCYVGYSAVLFGDAVRRAGGKRYYSLEKNPEFAAIATKVVELAGLRDFVHILVGRSDESLHRLYTSGEVTTVEFLFIDHYKPAYTPDLMLCEQLGMVQPNVSLVVADNVIYPGNPVYLDYVRSSVEQKREAAKDGPVRGYNTEGIPQRAVENYNGPDELFKPLYEVAGNPNLVYESQLMQPQGYPDAIEVTRCVGIAG